MGFNSAFKGLNTGQPLLRAQFIKLHFNMVILHKKRLSKSGLFSAFSRQKFCTHF